MPARIRDKGIRVMVKPNSLVGPFGEGTVLSQQYLEEVYHADIDHILRNGGVVEVSQDTPLTPIAGADLAPLIDRPHAVVGGAFNPVLLNQDGTPVTYKEQVTPHTDPPPAGRVPVAEPAPAAPAPAAEKTVRKNEGQQEEPPLGGSSAGAEGVDLGGGDDEEAPVTGTTNVTVPDPAPEEPAHRPVNTRGSRGRGKAK